MPDGINEALFKALEAHLKNKGLLADFRYPGVSRVSGEEVLEAEVDMLIPAALEGAIHAGNAYRVRAKFIVEGANGPTTLEANEILRKKKKVVVPDILANSGGVTVSYFEWIQNLKDEHWHLEAIDKMLEARMVTASEFVVKVGKAYRINLSRAAMILALIRVVDAEVARNESWRQEWKENKPYTSKIELFMPDTYEELNNIIARNKFFALVSAVESRKHSELRQIAIDIAEKFFTQAGVVLITGPFEVGEAMFANSLKQTLAEEGEKAKVFHLEHHQLTDVVELLKGGTIPLKTQELYYSGNKDASSLTLDTGETLIIEGDNAFSKELMNEFEARGIFTYKIFVNVAPSMKLKDNYPFLSLHARLLRGILDAKLKDNQRPSETIVKFLNQRKTQLETLYPGWILADKTVNSYFPYELPILKREIGELLAQERVYLAKEMEQENNMENCKQCRLE